MSEEKEVEVEDPKKEPGHLQVIFSELYGKFFGTSWEAWHGAVILSVFSIALYIVAYPWGSSGGLVNWGDNVLYSVGVLDDAPTPLLNHKFATLSITMLLGAAAAALLSKQFAFRIAPTGMLVKGFLGGTLMGVGAVLGMGCTIGGFYTAIPALSAGALVLAVGLTIGVWLAVKYIFWEMEAFPSFSMGKSHTFCAAKTEGKSIQPWIGLGLILLTLGMTTMFNPDNSTDQKILAFLIIGLLIGLVLQRSRFCIVRALREPFISADGGPAKAIIIGMLIALIGFVTLKTTGAVYTSSTYGYDTRGVGSNFWFPALVGGVIFGFGMTIAGGCTVGSTWRAGEGHVQLMLSLLGIIIAGSLTAEYIKEPFLESLPEGWADKGFLPDMLGNFWWGTGFMLLVLLTWYVIVRWNERTGKLVAM